MSTGSVAVEAAGCRLELSLYNYLGYGSEWVHSDLSGRETTLHAASTTSFGHIGACDWPLGMNHDHDSI